MMKSSIKRLDSMLGQRCSAELASHLNLRPSLETWRSLYRRSACPFLLVYSSCVLTTLMSFNPSLWDGHPALSKRQVTIPTVSLLSKRTPIPSSSPPCVSSNKYLPPPRAGLLFVARLYSSHRLHLLYNFSFVFAILHRQFHRPFHRCDVWIFSSHAEVGIHVTDCGRGGQRPNTNRHVIDLQYLSGRLRGCVLDTGTCSITPYHSDFPYYDMNYYYPWVGFEKRK